jgi:hypothetical protein
MARRQEIDLGPDPETAARRVIPVASAEDIVLQKLLWYRLGRGVSDRQWQDVLGVLKVRGESLDTVYLHQQARALEVDDLLQQALLEGRAKS